jgi:hypothetical protein
MTKASRTPIFGEHNINYWIKRMDFLSPVCLKNEKLGGRAKCQRWGQKHTKERKGLLRRRIRAVPNMIKFKPSTIPKREPYGGGADS